MFALILSGYQHKIKLPDALIYPKHAAMTLPIQLISETLMETTILKEPRNNQTPHLIANG